MNQILGNSLQIEGENEYNKEEQNFAIIPLNYKTQIPDLNNKTKFHLLYLDQSNQHSKSIEDPQNSTTVNK